jgi:hypothetical protein
MDRVSRQRRGTGPDTVTVAQLHASRLDARPASPYRGAREGIPITKAESLPASDFGLTSGTPQPFGLAFLLDVAPCSWKEIMPTYYCTACMYKHGLVSPVTPGAALPASGSYELEKFIKHTASGAVFSLNSVFNDPTWPTYHKYMVAAIASGSLEVDDQGRKNLYIYAGKETGLTQQSGGFVASCSGVKVVLSEQSGHIHAFPTSIRADSQVCARCGKLVPSHLTL